VNAEDLLKLLEKREKRILQRLKKVLAVDATFYKIILNNKPTSKPYYLV
jgi:hypothetical protein